MSRKRNTLISCIIFLILGGIVVGAASVALKRHKWEYYLDEPADLSKKQAGIYLDDLNELDSFDEIPGIVGWFEKWYENVHERKLAVIGKYKFTVPLITWEPWSVPLNEISEGLHDDYITEFFTAVNKTCPDNTVLIRFAHEMEMRPSYGKAWYPWQGKDPSEYISAWRHVYKIAKSIAPQVEFIWSPNRSDEYSDPYFPGSDYVDYVGTTANKASNYDHGYDDFGEYYSYVCGKRNLEKWGKPIIMPEIAYSPANEDENSRSEYIKNAFEYFMRDPKMTAIVFFDKDVSENRSFKFTDDKKNTEAFFEGLRIIKEAQSEAKE